MRGSGFMVLIRNDHIIIITGVYFNFTLIFKILSTLTDLNNIVLMKF